jgi:hypothetical protein
VRDSQWSLLAIVEPRNLSQAYYLIENDEANIDLKENDALVASCTYDNKENRTINKGQGYLDERCNIYLMYYFNSSNKNNKVQQVCSGNEYLHLERSIPSVDSKSSHNNFEIIEKVEAFNKTHQYAVNERQSSSYTIKLETRDLSTPASLRPWLQISIALLIVTLLVVALVCFICSKCKKNKKKLKLISFGKTFETKYIELSKWVSKDKEKVNNGHSKAGFVRLSQTSDEESKELNKLTFESFDGFEFDSNSESDSEIVITRLNDKY